MPGCSGVCALAATKPKRKKMAMLTLYPLKEKEARSACCGPDFFNSYTCQLLLLRNQSCKAGIHGQILVRFHISLRGLRHAFVAGTIGRLHEQSTGQRLVADAHNMPLRALRTVQV